MSITIKPKDARHSVSEASEAVSKALVEARLRARPLTEFPGWLPETLEQAYNVQAQSIERWPDELAGWKVAMLPEPDRERLGAQRLAGPVFESAVHSVEAGSRIVMPIYDGGFSAIEAEFVFRLGTAVPPTGREFTDDELVQLVSTMHCGAEIASSPIAVVIQRGATSIISDFGVNAGVLAGPQIPDWSSLALESLTATVTVDDAVVGNATAAAIQGGPLGALRFLIGHCATRNIELPAGAVVSTGAATGVHEVSVGSTARLDFGPFGWFDVEFEPRAATP